MRKMSLQNFPHGYVVITIVTILAVANAQRLPRPTNPGGGNGMTNPKIFAITGGVILGLALLFVFFKFRLWQNCCCRQCGKKRRTEEDYVEPPSLFTYPTNVYATPAPSQQNYQDVTDSNARVNDPPPEYHIQKYDGESNPAFSAISPSANTSILVNDEPPPPTYYDVTGSSVPPVVHSSSQQCTSQQFTPS